MKSTNLTFKTNSLCRLKAFYVCTVTILYATIHICSYVPAARNEFPFSAFILFQHYLLCARRVVWFCWSFISFKALCYKGHAKKKKEKRATKTRWTKYTRRCKAPNSRRDASLFLPSRSSWLWEYAKRKSIYVVDVSKCGVHIRRPRISHMLIQICCSAENNNTKALKSFE